jgi:hypothetical protein
VPGLIRAHRKQIGSRWRALEDRWPAEHCYGEANPIARERLMAGPTTEQIEHYVRLFNDRRAPEYLVETFWWTVIRPRRGELGIDEVARRVYGDPDAYEMRRPNEVGYDDELVFLEQRDDAVVLAAPFPPHAWEACMVNLSREADVHGVFWIINNFNRLSWAADGVMLTDLDVLDPQHAEGGSQPNGLDDHLGALIELSMAEIPGPDWETAMATMESLTGERLQADWFDRPQVLSRIDRSRDR